MWKLTRNLHDRCEIIFCPSEAPAVCCGVKGFSNVEIWSRGVDTELFNPQARDENLRESWGDARLSLRTCAFRCRPR